MQIKILEDNHINYKIEYNRAKRMRIHFNHQGELIITYPIGCKEESVTNFIEKNIQWIIKNQELNNSKQLSYQNGSEQLFFGKKYKLIVNISKTKRIDMIGENIIISVNKIEDVQKDLLKWRTQKAEFVFQEMLFACFNKMKDVLKSYPELVIKKSKSKWGCCYFNENKIMLNVALTQVSFEIIEYVICHELTHFVVHSHSPEFHRLLEKYVPGERALSKELKKYTSIL